MITANIKETLGALDVLSVLPTSRREGVVARESMSFR